METRNRDGGLDRRVMDNIRYNAGRLVNGRTIPGMEAEDCEQDLVLDLLRRQAAFDLRLASFPTFADRIVRNRISTLATPTLRVRCERKTTSLDAPAVDHDGNESTLVDLLPDDAPPIDDWVAVRLDVRRFVETLPANLVEGCEVLLADSVAAGAQAAGIHRSTAYDRAGKLREEATARGLDIYFGRLSDSRVPPPVHGRQDASRQGVGLETTSVSHWIKPPRVHLLVTENELREWLAHAEGGEALEYHRGALAIDRLRLGSRLPDEEREELDRVAKAAFAIAESGHGYLLQRRHGEDDYTYLLVARPKSVPAAGRVAGVTDGGES